MEVRKAIKNLKNRKSAGADGTINELIKYERPTLAKVFEEGRILNKWKAGILIRLHYLKKGDKEYR